MRNLAALAAMLALCACGQKGPLFLPDEGGEVVVRPTQTPPAEPVPAPAPVPAPEVPKKDGDDETKPPTAPR